MPEPPPDLTLYVKPEDVAEAFRIDGSIVDDHRHIERATKAASRAVESFCRGRRFWLDPEPVERRFITNDPTTVDLRPDLAELTAVEVDGQTWTAGEDFELEPMNAPADGWPWTRLVAVGGRRWPTGRPARIVVEGRWGWLQVPAEVEQGAMLVAQRLVKRREAPFGIASMPSWEGIGMRLLERFDADGTVLLYRYKLPPGIA